MRLKTIVEEDNDDDGCDRLVMTETITRYLKNYGDSESFSLSVSLFCKAC